MTTPATVLCLIIVLVELIFVPLYLKKMWPTKNWHSLACKMVCASGYLITAAVCAVQSGGAYARLMLAGFAFSWLGDLLLHIPRPTKAYFLAGVLMFGLAHVFYCAAYLKIQQSLFYGRSAFLWNEVVFVVLLTAVFIVAVWFKGVRFGAMAAPVAVYGCLVSMMALKAVEAGVALLLGGSEFLPAIFLMLGGMLFLFSDGSLALINFDTRYKKFRLKIFNAATYFSAQLFLSYTILFF